MKPSLALLPLVLAACGTDTSDDPPSGTMTDPVTYWRDIEPILYTNCVTCHTEGGIGPFALDELDSAVNYAPRIATETGARRMPPWPPGGDTPALLHTRALTDDQIAKLKAWADAGAPVGDPADKPVHQEPEVIDIGPTQVHFDIGLDYTPDTALSDDYRCFLADLGTTTAGVATGFEVTPGNRAIVHHVIVGLFAAEDRAVLQALDDETPDRAGWPCVGGLTPTDGSIRQTAALGSWVPGVSAVAYPAGTGTPIQAGQLAVIQVHYNLLGGSDPDRTRVAVAMAPPDQASKLIRLAGLTLIRHNLTIPINDAAAVNQQSATASQWRALRGGGQALQKAYILGAGGHMHLVGKRITLTRTNAAGTTTLLDIPDWNFHWQGDYQYVQPIEIAGTDTLTIRCEYDNSTQNRLTKGLPPGVAVSWGEGTQDEMCLASLQLVDRLP